MPRKNVPPHADFGRALQQLRAARGVTQEDMLLATNFGAKRNPKWQVLVPESEQQGQCREFSEPAGQRCGRHHALNILRMGRHAVVDALRGSCPFQEEWT